MTFQQLYARYAEDMERVNHTMDQTIQSRNPSLTEAAEQLMTAGGKRIRPLFALICSRAGSGQRESNQVYALAAALELIHMATLVHDDVIDDADLRRGQSTVKSRFGNRPAMYSGDFLFAKAIALLCSISHPNVHPTMSNAMVRMCEGEIDQLGDFFNWQQNLRSYLRRIERKTALLISVSCELGALVGGADASTAKRLGRFGYATGMAFQMIDDVLDYEGDQTTVGKPVGGDLRQGNLTLPALHAKHTSEMGQALSQLVHVDMDEGQVKEALSIVRESGSMEYTKCLAHRYMQRALGYLDELNDADVTTELTEVAQFLNQRLY